MASDDALLAVDPMGIVVEWSPQAESLFGIAAAEIVGGPVAALLAGAWPGRDGAAADGAEGAAAHGFLVRPVRRPDGSTAWAAHLPQPPENAADGVGQALLEALFTQSPIGMQVLDPELRIQRVNTATATMSTMPASQLVGRRVRDVLSLSDPEAVDAMVRHVLETGTPAIGRLVGFRPPGDPQREHVYSVSVFRLQDAGGRVLGTATEVVDVTDRERALTRTRVLNHVREHLGNSLDMETTCTELVDLLVPVFADAAEVDLLDPVIRGEDPPQAPVGPDVPLRRLAFASTDRRRHSLNSGTGPFRFPSAWTQCLTDLQPRLVAYGRDDTTPEPGAALPPAPRPSGSHSAVIAPLILRGGVLGTLSLFRTSDRDPFDQEDLDLALELATRLSLQIDNGCRYTREHTIALTLQRRLLPSNPPEQAALETARFHLPGGSGGGWFDVIPLSGARIALTVGHVAGEGIHTITAMGQLRTAIHTLSLLDLEPDELLALLNDTVVRLAAERAALPPSDPVHRQSLTAGCVYGIYDPLALSFTVARAGHPPPLLAHPDGTTETPDIPSAPSLGREEGTPFAAARLELAKGSIIALHTDGFLPPGEAGARIGLDVLRSILSDTGRPLSDLRDEAVHTIDPAADGEGEDDVILLLVRTHTLNPDQVALWDLPADPAAVATARARIRAQLVLWGLEDLSFSTELIVSELATNAVRYGAPPVKIRLIRDRSLTLEVSDSSAAAPHLHHARTSDEGGRGLFICAELAQRWGVRYEPGGKTIWFEQDLPAAATAYR